MLLQGCSNWSGPFYLIVNERINDFMGPALLCQAKVYFD